MKKNDDLKKAKEAIGCPFRDCQHHLSHLGKGGACMIVNMDGTCRRYIEYLVECEQKR